MKQKSFQGSPKLITVGINEKAMHVIHPKSKVCEQ